MSVKVSGQITKHFSINEYAVANPKSEVYISERSVKHTQCLEKLRVRYNKIIHVNAYYRTAETNRRVKGVANSNHLTGTAADIHFNIRCTETVARTVIKMWKDICEACGEVGEAGWYPGWDPNGGLHLGFQNSQQRIANNHKFINWKCDPKTGKLIFGYFKNI